MERGRKLLVVIGSILQLYANDRRKRITAFKTILNSTVRENIANIFGARKVQNLLHFDVKLEKDAVNLFQEGDTPQLNAASIQGLMSKASAEANHASDRQLFYVNSRPCHLPQVSKSFNEIYKLFNLNFSPFVFANLLLSPDRYEVRLLPGKTTIHLHDEQELLETLKSSLSQLLKAQPFSFPQNTKSSQLPSLKQNQSREGYDSSILSDNKRHNDDYHEINTNSRKTKNAPKEATPSVSGDDSGSDEADCRSDGITDDPALPSSCIEKEQELERYPEKRAFRPQMHSTHTGSIHQSTEKDLDYRNFKRPRLEISSRGGSTSPIELAKVSCTAKNTIMWSDNAIDTNHSQEGSPGPDTAPAAPNRFSAKGNHAAVRATLSGINLQQDKVGNLERREQYQNEPRAIDDGSGFTSARNHRDITLLQNNKQEDQRESIESHHLVINDDKSRQRTPPVDEDRELEQIETGTVNGEEGIVDEREYQAYQKSKVSSLIARAEEARVISSKNLKIRAVSALSAIHRSGGMMKPVRSLKFTASSSRIKNLYFKGLIKYDDKVMNNDMKDLEDKVDSLSLSKSEFASMRVIGQFNYGFVLAVKAQQKAEAFASPDLFIIDQHASDEKYNFENYENTLSIKSQRLAQPQRIELTAVEEELISRHNDVLIKNGFKLSLEDNYQAGGVSQQRLVGLPSLGGVLYNKSDFQDLLNILSESNEERVDHKFFLPRPAKTRKILAMKACRSSIMIGKSLSKSQMKQIILQMGRIEKPWHCPHGRPTIKYLSSLSKFKQWREGDGVVGIASGSGRAGCTDWTAYLR